MRGALTHSFLVYTLCSAALSSGELANLKNKKIEKLVKVGKLVAKRRPITRL